MRSSRIAHAWSSHARSNRLRQRSDVDNGIETDDGREAMPSRRHLQQTQEQLKVFIGPWFPGNVPEEGCDGIDRMRSVPSSRYHLFVLRFVASRGQPVSSPINE